MVVATHRVAMDTLVLGSYALGPTILLGVNPQPHLLLNSLMLIYAKKNNFFCLAYHKRLYKLTINCHLSLSLLMAASHVGFSFAWLVYWSHCKEVVTSSVLDEDSPSSIFETLTTHL